MRFSPAEIEEMYHNHPFSRHFNSLRHRKYFRNTLYAGVTFIVLCGLYYYSLSPQDPLAKAFPPEERPAVPAYTPPDVWNDRASQVKRAFQHAYHGYERYAAPHDELKPLSNDVKNPFNGWGVSIFDSLDTMLLMKLDGEFQRALPLVERATFSIDDDEFAPFFETTIRYLGGLLSAYALSREPLLLQRADDLAQMLDPIFKPATGFPLYGVNTINGNTVGPEIGILAEMASLQLEYTYLAKVTGKKQYFDRADTIIKALAAADLRNTGGMLPIRWNLTTAQPYDSHLSVGAQADSAHEYLLKQYLLTAKTDKVNLEMYIRATTHIIADLLYISPTRHLLYVTDTDTSTYSAKGRPSHVFEHLSCFLPGLLALGAHTLPLDDLESLGINLDDIIGNSEFGHPSKGYQKVAGYNLKELHMWAAEGLAQTCWLTYADQPTGLGPDEILMKTKDPNSWGGPDDGWGVGGGVLWIDAMQSWKGSGARGVPPGVGEKPPVIYSEQQRLRGNGRGRDYAVKKPGYLLRPETIESLFVMWKATGDVRWRERGWAIFESIERECRTPTGYASLKTVERSPGAKDDDMPSYFLAETLKYLYLLFINEDPIPLDKWVFNTEAHPFPVFEWTEREKEIFGI